MRSRYSLGLLLAALIIPGAVPAADTELAAFREATRALYDLKEQAFADDDPEPILTRFYSADVISTDLEGNTHMGTAGLRPLYEQVVTTGTVKVESVHPHVNGNMGWDWANFHVTPDDPAEAPFTFKILFLWERVDGQWICKGDMYVMGRFEPGAHPH